MIIKAGDDELIKPYLDLGDGMPVWRWNGTHGVSHTVRLETPEGTVRWEVWINDTPLSDMATLLKGRDAAVALIVRWRRSGGDLKHANRKLRKNGYAATQHYTGPDCNCEGCTE